MRDMISRNIGVNFDENGEAFVRFWAPAAKEVDLVLELGVYALKADSFGYWELSTAALKQAGHYRFKVDGKEIPDQASLWQPEGVHGPSAAYDLKSFTWSDESWQNYPLCDYLLYELHTGTFTAEASFEGIIGKLDYLKDLGITAIELMPVAAFPGERNWGYDGVFPFAVQNSYGGPAGLQHLVDCCHEKGLAVVLDVVYNHLGPEGNYFPVVGPYFTEKYHTPWGSAINFDDAWSDGVRSYFIENMLMWFRDFHIDALRLDAVHAIKDSGVKHLLKEMREELDRLMALTGRKHYLIAECDLNDHKYIDAPASGGYGMDAQWIDEFHHALRVTAGEPAKGYYSDFSGIRQLEKAYRDAYVYDGIYSPHRQKTFGGPAENNPGEQFVVFSQNHDQVGNRMLGERSAILVSYEMQKLMAAAVLCSPYLPMLFMGEEWGETNPFLFFTSHGDPELIEAVRKGRKAEFKDFHAEGEAPDPQDQETFRQSLLQWNLLDEQGHRQLLDFYREMIRLRKNHRPLSNMNRKQLEVSSAEASNCLLLRRWDGEEQVLCVLNFSDRSQEILLPDHAGLWYKLLDSADPKWNGPASSAGTVKGAQKITIQPESILIYNNLYV